LLEITERQNTTIYMADENSGPNLGLTVIGGRIMYNERQHNYGEYSMSVNDGNLRLAMKVGSVS
jgi:hypothetical protein